MIIFTHRIKLILSLHVSLDEEDVVDCFLYHEWQLSSFLSLLCS